MVSLCEKWKWRCPFIQRSWPPCPQCKLWPWLTCFFYRQNKFWRRGGFTAREAEVTQLITLCHCVPGCPNISVSPLCVKHDGDNSKSQTFSNRKNKSDIFPPLKQTENLLILREIASVRPPQFKGRKFWCFVASCLRGQNGILYALYENILC